MTEKGPSFVKSEYSLEPRASSDGLSLMYLKSLEGHSEDSVKIYGRTSVVVRVQGRM